MSREREDRIAVCERCKAEFVWVWKRSKFDPVLTSRAPQHCRPCRLRLDAFDLQRRARKKNLQANQEEVRRDTHVLRIRERRKRKVS